MDTISNTVSVRENGEIFVATGDIPAMWLRDSTFQILPYLEMADSIPEITSLVHGVLRQQLRYINHDPYANAFNKEPTDNHYSQDVSNVQISPLVWERKFEIDSLCAPLFLLINSSSIQAIANTLRKIIGQQLNLFSTLLLRSNIMKAQTIFLKEQIARHPIHYLMKDVENQLVIQVWSGAPLDRVMMRVSTVILFQGIALS